MDAPHKRLHEFAAKRLKSMISMGMCKPEQMLCCKRGSLMQGIKLELKRPPDSPLIAQPPADHVQGHAAMLHYTWGTLIEKDKEKVWIFDKRDYTAPEIERVVSNSPLSQGCDS